MNTLNKCLISTLILAGLSLNLAEAAAPPGKTVTPSTAALQGGSTSTVKWAAPGTFTYKVHVFVPNTGKVTNALYRVYPKGKRAGDSPCSGKDPLYPCFEVTIDQTQHKNAWVQLTLNDDPKTQWAFTKTRGYVVAVADNLGSETLLNVSTQIRFAEKFKIGDTYPGGGIIFYIDGSGRHGLIAAPMDQSDGIPWNNGNFMLTGADGTEVGTGLANTDAIIAALGVADDYAAWLARKQRLFGHHDWFLPSLGELNLMYKNIGPGAPAPLTNIGKFSRTYYWSSSEVNGDDVWVQHFGYLNNRWGLIYNKKWGLRVRAVRAF